MSFVRSSSIRRATLGVRHASTQPSVPSTTGAAKSTLEHGQQRLKELGNKLQQSKAYEEASKQLMQVGERTGSMLGAYKEPLMHNAAIARELGKQIYIQEGLAPPTSFSQIRAVWQHLYTQASQLPFWRSAAQNGQWKRIAIYAIEAYGIFKIGEMIGRRHMVGYKLNNPAAQTTSHH